jgi:hypothetical protein
MGWVRGMTLLALLVVVAAIGARLEDVSGVADNIDATTLVLLFIAIVLGYALVAPRSVKEIFDRITTLKLPGGVEIGLQAADRVARIEAQIPIVAAGGGADEVETTPLPRDGEVRGQCEAVQDRLQERLRFVNRVILEYPEDTNYKRIVRRIEEERLLADDELEVVHDILNGLKENLYSLPPLVRDEYLEASWRFSTRFATLTFERLVRRKLTESGSFLLDFAQAKSHRPDFLAFRGGHWLLIAARVEPGNTRQTRRRLSRQELPFDATPLLVLPDKRPYEHEEGDEYPVPSKTLSQLLDSNSPGCKSSEPDPA